MDDDSETRNAASTTILRETITAEEFDAGVDTMQMVLRLAVEHDAAELRELAVKRKRASIRLLAIAPTLTLAALGLALWLRATHSPWGDTVIVMLLPFALLFAFIGAVMYMAGRWGSEAHMVRALHFQKNAARYSALLAEIARRHGN